MKIEVTLARRPIRKPGQALGVGNMQRLPAFLEAPGTVVSLPSDVGDSSDVSAFDSVILLILALR